MGLVLHAKLGHYLGYMVWPNFINGHILGMIVSPFPNAFAPLSNASNVCVRAFVGLTIFKVGEWLSRSNAYSR